MTECKTFSHETSATTNNPFTISRFSSGSGYVTEVISHVNLELFSENFDSYRSQFSFIARTPGKYVVILKTFQPWNRNGACVKDMYVVDVV